MEGLGIDWKLLILQIVNFLILLWLLKRFVYKPFLALLSKRRSQIEEGVKKAEEAETSLAKIRSLAEEVKTSGEKRAKELIVAAEHKAQEKAKNIAGAAEEERKKMIDTAKRAIEAERLREKERQQKETVDMAFALAEKFMGQSLSKEQDRKIIEKCAEDLKQA